MVLKESRRYISGKFWNSLLEKDGKNQLYRSCEKWGSITQSQWGEEYRNITRRRKTKWIGLILCRNCLLKYGTEGNYRGKGISDGRLRRRRNQLLDDLKETSYWNLKEKTLDRTLWRTRFGKGCWPVLWQITKLLNIHAIMKVPQNENSIELVVIVTTFYWMKINSV